MSGRLQVFSVAPNGANIAFIDSGAPMNQDIYKTLLIVHGFMWNSGVFQKVIDNAPAHGIRAIAINRRGYKGSSPFTSSELSALEAHTCTPEDRKMFMAGQAMELADFVKQLIDNNMVSAPNGRQGGVAILGWSLGNSYVFDFLSHITTLSDRGLSTLMKQYLREYIVFDPPPEVFGLPPPSSKYVSMKSKVDRISDPVEAGNAWNDFISGSYQFPPVPSHLSADLSTWSDEYKQARYGPPHDEPIGKSTRAIEAESGSSVFQECNEPGAMRSDVIIGLIPPMRGELRPVTDAILFEDPGESLWPGMRVEYAYCANTVPPILYAAEALRFRFEKAVPDRRMKLIPNSNHFFPWVDPNRFLEEMVRLM